jgi:hypothetical protein
MPARIQSNTIMACALGDGCKAALALDCNREPTDTQLLSGAGSGLIAEQTEQLEEALRDGTAVAAEEPGLSLRRFNSASMKTAGTAVATMSSPGYG